MPLHAKVLPGFQEDLYDLPENVRKAAAIAFADIRDGRRQGAQLTYQPSVGDLSDCFKLYFDPNPRVQPRYRLVYQVHHNSVTVVAVTAVAVGERAGLDAYLRAMRNLGR